MQIKVKKRWDECLKHAKSHQFSTDSSLNSLDGLSGFPLDDWIYWFFFGYEAFGFSKVWLVFRLDLDSLPFLIQICNRF